MNPARAVSSLDKATKVSLGVIFVLLSATATGAAYLGNLNHNVLDLAIAVKDLKDTIDANTEKLSHNGIALATLRIVVENLDERVDTLEGKK